MKHAGRNTLLTILIAVASLLVAGCTLLSPVQNETKKAVLNQLPLEIPQRTTHPATLLVLPPESSPIFDTTQMAYRVQPYVVDYFTKNEWSATPARMLQPLLVKTLEDTHYFSEILTPPYPGSYTYALRTEIIEFIQDFSVEPATMHLSLRIQLLDVACNKIISTREITLHEPMLQKTPYAGVVAANNATAKALLEVAGFVTENSNKGCDYGSNSGSIFRNVSSFNKK